MNSFTNSAVKREATALSIAHIEAQHTEFIDPLREYLSANGCQVYVNKKPPLEALYHIVCGDLDFVKSIFSAHPQRNIKRLVVIWGADEEDVRKFLPARTKVVLTDGRVMSADDITSIFTFLFTSEAETCDIRKDPHVALPKASVFVQQGRERSGRENLFQPGRFREQVEVSGRSDSDRVQRTIAEIFHLKKSSPGKRQGKSQCTKKTLACLFVLILPVVMTIALLLAGSCSLVLSARFMSSKISYSRLFSQANKHIVNYAEFFLQLALWEFRLVGVNGQLRPAEEFAGFMRESSVAIENILALFDAAGSITNGLLRPQEAPGGEGSMVSQITELRSLISATNNHLALSQTRLAGMLKGGSLPFSLAPAENIGQKAYQAITTVRRQSSFVENLLSLYPIISGLTKPQTYLLLFQNSMELRPTGGFIGSLGVARFSGGVMEDLQVRDVYEVDGQLKGHVDPPPPLRDLMGQEHWYLRDSNWDPDFPTSAAKALWFYEKETGVRVDGVIGVSVPFVVNLLKATGPLVLSDLNDSITAENFFGKSLLYTQTDFFPGSTQKKDFLGYLSQALIAQLFSRNGASSAKVLKATIDAFEGHDLLLYFADRQLQTIAKQYGWAGDAPASVGGCASVSEEPLCTGDRIYLTEANVGVNKVNYFMKREVLHQVTLAQDGTTGHTLTVRFKNSSRDGQNGGGSYRTYLQLFIPADAIIQTVIVDGKELNEQKLQKKTLADLPYWEVITTGEAQRIGIALEVLPGADCQVLISYQRQLPFVFEAGRGRYRLFIQKQPGVSSGQWQTVLTYPTSWGRERSGGNQQLLDPSLAKPGQLQYNTDLLRDGIIDLVFGGS
ncbi:DUF4012 domain-containing protein [Patescibacteria group bacterium]|nr:DUF4012 domain-containing protein [Patescibacteria group bacterium]MBU1472852.1 DUF4012 domain-containing protein [Patescibacteria group bacterium]MBU2459509.1 DUF4012 domain-containing protein [Patescibacteria group bacterium]MBU2543958.1 DUF4012 domain-containing protein [Patescibacteria group bacterium]